jgi:hypothetical protein
MKSASSIFQNLKLKPPSNNSVDNVEAKNKMSDDINKTSNSVKNKISSASGSHLPHDLQFKSPCAEFDTKIIKMEKTKVQSNYLTNTLLSKIGPSYIVGYLGSAILTKGKTGLGCLQQPLRELYSIFRQNDANLVQERRLGISVDGLTMFFNECGVEKFLHNELSSVYDVQLLKLVCEQRKDKKFHWAFLPIGNYLYLLILTIKRRFEKKKNTKYFFMK